MAKAAAKTNPRTARRLARVNAVLDTPAPAPEANAVRPSQDLTAPPGFIFLRHADIKPDPDNARKHFDEEALQQLADSLVEKGLLQPPSVRPAGPDGLHQLTMGERRWRAWDLNIAAGAVGETSGKWDADRYELCRLGEADDVAAMEAGLVENLQREDLNHIEMAKGFELLATRFNRSNKDIARATSRTPEYIQQHRRLVKLEAYDQTRIIRGELTLHDAIKKLGSPKYKDLKPFEALVLGELAAVLWRAGKWDYSYADVQIGRGVDARQGMTVSREGLDGLVKRQLLRGPGRSMSTFRWTMTYGWEFTKDVKVLFPLFAEVPPDAGEDAQWPELDAFLAQLRAAAFGPEFQLQPGDLYSTPWLNPPFDIAPEEQAELDRRAKRDAEEKARAERAKQAAAKAAANLKAVTTGFKQAPLAPLPDLQSTLELLGVTLPLSRSGDMLVDAAGRQILNVGYEYSSHGKPPINRGGAIQLIAAAVNAATGYARTAVEDVAAAEDIDPLGDLKEPEDDPNGDQAFGDDDVDLVTPEGGDDLAARACHIDPTLTQAEVDDAYERVEGKLKSLAGIPADAQPAEV